MSTVSVVNVKHPSSASNNLVLDNAGNATFANNVTVAGNMTSTGMVVPSSSFLRNRIINGDMRIDQRNNGASITLTSGITSASYAVDRWRACRGASSTATAQRSTIAPAGFTNSYLYTVGTGAAPAASDFSIIQQLIEGFNIADLGWGGAGAQSVTLSFWVRSSLTGTFGLVVTNSAQTLAYATTYTIAAANTFEFKTITIPGPTSATWLTDNGTGLQLTFDMGVGSNQSVGASASWQSGNFLGVTGVTKPLATSGATFYLTGVQLEVGSVATPFERRQFGQELALCQRYYEKSYDTAVVPGSNTQNGVAFVVTNGTTAANQGNTIPFAAEKRAAPTIATWDVVGNANRASSFDGSANRTDNQSQVVQTYGIGTRSVAFRCSNGIANAVSIAYHWTAAAEL